MESLRPKDQLHSHFVVEGKLGDCAANTPFTLSATVAPARNVRYNAMTTPQP